MRLTILASCLLATFATYAEGLYPPPEADIVLAENYQSGINIDEYWYSEKLDGIRAYWTGEQLQTRSGKKIHAPAWFVQALPNYPLDGELWAGRGHFHLVQQTVLDATPIDQAWQQIRFMIFDSPHTAGDYRKRYHHITDLVRTMDVQHIQYVEHMPIQSEQALFAHLDEIDQQQGEGIMLRKISSRYQAGRSSDLLKLKRYQDDEAVVIGYKPGSGRLMGKMGAILVRLGDGTEFYIGSGFTDVQRETPPAIGSTITFRYNGLTHNGIPKFARYLRQRVTQ